MTNLPELSAHDVAEIRAFFADGPINPNDKSVVEMVTRLCDTVTAIRSNPVLRSDAVVQSCGGVPTPEAQVELDDFAHWLRVPKPRQGFRVWRASQPVAWRVLDSRGVPVCVYLARDDADRAALNMDAYGTSGMPHRVQGLIPAATT